MVEPVPLKTPQKIVKKQQVKKQNEMRDFRS